MYRNSYQRGMLTVFFSVGSKPLAIWDIHAQEGYLSRFLDQDIKSMVLEIRGTNISTTYITCPKGNMVLGITMPFLVMIVKNLKKYFSFEVTILDETKTRRRFRVSNFQSSTQILPLCTVMPIGLSDGWNQIQFNLAEFTRRAYKKQYVETQKLKINANIRLRRIYFCERLQSDDQLPPEYKLYFPLASKAAKEKKSIASNKENIVPSSKSNKEINDQTESNENKTAIVSETKVAVESNDQYDAQNAANFLAEAVGDKEQASASKTVIEESDQRDARNVSIVSSKDKIDPPPGDTNEDITATVSESKVVAASDEYEAQNAANVMAEALGDNIETVDVSNTVEEASDQPDAKNDAAEAEADKDPVTVAFMTIPLYTSALNIKSALSAVEAEQGEKKVQFKHQ